MHKKTHLIAVTGMTPAVVTETLYGIAKEDAPWPSQITLITTKKGKEKILTTLSQFSAIEAVCKEVGKPIIPFSEKDIQVVPNAEGKEVEDAKSLADHEALADYIMTFIRNACLDENVRIHASIAGGRKTMTFYLGYAMSIFGRSYDRLSHVLINESFENIPGFFFPTHEKHEIHLKDREGQLTGEVLNTQDAKVILADIPFVRQRHLFDFELIHSMKQKINFRHLVELVNLSASPDRILLEVYPKSYCIKIYDRDEKHEVAQVYFENHFYWAFYLFLLRSSICDEVEKYKNERYSGRFLYLVLKELVALYDQKINYKTDDQYINEIIDYFSMQKTTKEQTKILKSLNSLGSNFTKSKYENFNTVLNSIKNTYLKELPLALVEHLIPKQQGDKKQLAHYDLSLPDPKAQIQFR